MDLGSRWLTSTACVALLWFAMPAPGLAQDPVQYQTQVSRHVARAITEKIGFSQLSNADAAAFLSGILIVSPEEYEQLLRAPASVAKVKTPGFSACVRAFQEFAVAITPLLGRDRRELEEMYLRHGLDPAMARRSFQGDRELVALAQELAQEGRLAQLYTQSGHNSEEAQAIRKHRQMITDLGRAGFAQTMSGTLPGVAAAVSQQSWATLYQRRAQQALIISGLFCPG